MTREEFLARCAVAFDAGLLTDARLRLLRDGLDALARIEAAEFGQDRLSAGQQWGIWRRFLDDERHRLRVDERPDYVPTLANDPDLSALIAFASRLAHPCQECGVDPDAWVERTAFCPHWKRGDP